MSEYAVAFKTDVGRQRTTNEDAGAIFDAPGCDTAFVVCDGMGGLRAGEVAANEATRVVQETIVERMAEAEADPLEALRVAFRRANDVVNARNQGERASRPASPDEEDSDGETSPETRILMGTTCIAGIIRNNVLFVGHAGDSRAYLWRGGRLIRLTDDHSFVGERVKAGDMTEAEAKRSRFRNIVTRAIGIEEIVNPDFRQQEMEPGDLLLVCTDGLTTMAEDSEIAAMLFAPALRTAPPERIVDTLIDAANRRGGNDNISVAVLRAPGVTAIPEERSEEVKRAMPRFNDAPRRKESTSFGPSSLLPALVGAGLMLLLLLLLFVFFPSLRDSLVRPSGATRPAGSTVGVTRLDLAHVTYDRPTRFVDMLVRGDLLSYSPGDGLYFVAGVTGNITRVDVLGKLDPTPPVESVPVPDRLSTDLIPETQVFMTTDVQGNVYIAFTRRKRIVKKSPTGAMLATLDGFLQPEALAVDEQGNIYVIDRNEIKVCRARIVASPSATPAASATPVAPTTGSSPAPTATPTP